MKKFLCGLLVAASLLAAMPQKSEATVVFNQFVGFSTVPLPGFQAVTVVDSFGTVQSFFVPTNAQFVPGYTAVPNFGFVHNTAFVGRRTFVHFDRFGRRVFVRF